MRGLSLDLFLTALSCPDLSRVFWVDWVTDGDPHYTIIFHGHKCAVELAGICCLWMKLHVLYKLHTIMDFYHLGRLMDELMARIIEVLVTSSFNLLVALAIIYHNIQIMEFGSYSPIMGKILLYYIYKCAIYTLSHICCGISHFLFKKMGVFYVVAVVSVTQVAIHVYIVYISAFLC
ncbi:hypothetical protein ACJX0J_015139, partial [Zea mays]